jgi:hypothetical protein
MWNNDLENALLELLIAIDDDLVSVVRSLRSMLQSFGDNNGTKDMEQMLNIVTGDVQKALCDHSAYAVGRLHQTLVQFMEVGKGPMSAMVNIPEAFTRAMTNFINAKLLLHPRETMEHCLNNLVSSVHTTVFTFM